MSAACERCGRPVGLLPNGRCRPYRTDALGRTVCHDTPRCNVVAAGQPPAGHVVGQLPCLGDIA